MPRRAARLIESATMFEALEVRKLMAADLVIWNDGDIEALHARCDEVWTHLLELAAKKATATDPSKDEGEGA